LDALADLVEDAGRVHAGDIGRRVLLEVLGPRPGGDIGVGRVHGGGVDADAHLAWARVRFREVEHLERVRPAEVFDADDPHDHALSSGMTSAANRRMLASASSMGMPPKRKAGAASNGPINSRRARYFSITCSGVPWAVADRKPSRNPVSPMLRRTSDAV